MRSELEQLIALGTVVVADTGDIKAIKTYRPTDATTNPSLLLAAASMSEYQHLVDDAILFGAGDLGKTMDKLGVNFGVEILKIVPGLVSTEVDARLSFDVQGTIAKAKELVQLYKQAGIASDRILIKIASTWEGIQAAKILESDNIHVNMTLMFSLCQAVAAAEAGATLVSPFVGRILDWYKANTDTSLLKPENDPGVKSVREIWTYFARFGYKTLVMGASFRNKDEILQLAGCQKLTIAPKFLEELSKGNDTVERKLDHEQATLAKIEPIPVDEKSFRWMLNEDAMATEKLAHGIRTFAADTVKLEAVVKVKMAEVRSAMK